DSKAGASVTRSVVRNYVQSNPNDLYILVKKSSDDPANWPWSLKEFILSQYPKGLGLKKAQTVVCGTRAKEFIQNEKNDVKTQDQLLERVKKRCVSDFEGTNLNLSLLELFCLTLEQKESLSFIEKRNLMNQQIGHGRNEILQMLANSFQPTANMERRQQLMDFFDGDKFKRDLNARFQLLLCDQLVLLERRLIQKKGDIRKHSKFLTEEIANQSPQTCREFIKLFLREFMQIVTDLVTGNYSVMRMVDNGRGFLEKYGGSLKDNLQQGHQLALSLFKDKSQYSPDFLESLMGDKSAAADKDTAVKELKVGSAIRFKVSKDDSNMFGVVANILQLPENSEHQKDIVVNFFFQNPQGGADQAQQKHVERNRLGLLQSVNSNASLQGHTFNCWRRMYRPDNWIGLQPVNVTFSKPDENPEIIV
ncbi:arginyl-tRna synthetase, partial [Cardiosporidium cionae]